MTRVPTAIGDHGVPVAKRWKLGETPWRDDEPAPPSMRLIIDNDFSGDPDDLYQLVHHLLSPTVDIRLIVASHLRPGDPLDPSEHTAANAELVVHDVLARMGLEAADRVVAGAPHAIPDMVTPHDGPAARAIVEEAMRDDDRPLYYAAGGGLTDLASASLLEPRIASRLTLIWIGGNEHDGLALPPPGAMPIEYNLLIDVEAGRVLFAAADLTIWQVPRDIYRQCLVSETELRQRVGGAGPLGGYLMDETRHVMDAVARQGGPHGETYALGDSPLVLLTALQSVFQSDSSSSFHVTRPTPEITDDGGYRQIDGARPMRIYTQVDVRLMFEDLFLKLNEFCRWQADR